MSAGCQQEYRSTFRPALELAEDWTTQAAHDHDGCVRWLDGLKVPGSHTPPHFPTPTSLTCDGDTPVMTVLGPKGEVGGTGAETDVVVRLLPDGRLQIDAPFARSGREIVDPKTPSGDARFWSLVDLHRELLVAPNPWRYVAY
jgi:hypothetical protein